MKPLIELQISNLGLSLVLHDDTHTNKPEKRMFDLSHKSQGQGHGHEEDNKTRIRCPFTNLPLLLIRS